MTATRLRDEKTISGRRRPFLTFFLFAAYRTYASDETLLGHENVDGPMISREIRKIDSKGGRAACSSLVLQARLIE